MDVSQQIIAQFPFSQMVVDGPKIAEHSDGDYEKDRWRTEILNHIRSSVSYTKRSTLTHRNP
jgi:hypothetical protein